MYKVRLAMCASDPLTRAGISSHVRTRPEIELLTDVRLAEADVVAVVVDVIDADVIKRLRELSDTGAARFVLVAERLGNVDVLAMVEVGVVAVLWRAETTGERFTRSVLTASRGIVDLPIEIQGRLVEDVARLQRTVLAPNGLTASGLDERELEVLGFLAEGLDTAEIAKKMLYSERTVKNLVYRITTRLRLRNRVHAVAYAIRAGVL